MYAAYTFVREFCLLLVDKLCSVKQQSIYRMNVDLSQVLQDTVVPVPYVHVLMKENLCLRCGKVHEGLAII